MILCYISFYQTILYISCSKDFIHLLGDPHELFGLGLALAVELGRAVLGAAAWLGVGRRLA